LRRRWSAPEEFEQGFFILCGVEAEEFENLELRKARRIVTTKEVQEADASWCFIRMVRSCRSNDAVQRKVSQGGETTKGGSELKRVQLQITEAQAL
jgi:hypothetical protein